MRETREGREGVVRAASSRPAPFLVTLRVHVRPRVPDVYCSGSDVHGVIVHALL